MENGFFYHIFSRRWPVMLVVVAGIVFAIVRWRRHPKVSALTLAGLVLYQVQSIVFAALYFFLPRLATKGWSWRSIDHTSLVIEVFNDIFFAASIAFLAAAVFTNRPGRDPGKG